MGEFKKRINFLKRKVRSCPQCSYNVEHYKYHEVSDKRVLDYLKEIFIIMTEMKQEFPTKKIVFKDKPWVNKSYMSECLDVLRDEWFNKWFGECKH